MPIPGGRILQAAGRARAKVLRLELKFPFFNQTAGKFTVPPHGGEGWVEVHRDRPGGTVNGNSFT